MMKGLGQKTQLQIIFSIIKYTYVFILMMNLQISECPYASSYTFVDHFSYFLLNTQGALTWQRFMPEKYYEKKHIFDMHSGKYDMKGITPLT